jgi:hypothetical protein
MNSIEHPTMSSCSAANRTIGNLRAVGADRYMNDIGINRMCDDEMNKYGEYRIF